MSCISCYWFCYVSAHDQFAQCPLRISVEGEICIPWWCADQLPQFWQSSWLSPGSLYWLCKAGLKLKAKSVDSWNLGHFITSEGIQPDPEKINSVANYPAPLTSMRSGVFWDWPVIIRDLCLVSHRSAAPLHCLLFCRIPSLTLIILSFLKCALVLRVLVLS